MKTLIIGGGKGCRSLIGLLNDPIMKEVNLDIIGVMDINQDAPGMVYAREIGLQTFTNMKDALSLKDIEMIIEMTGQDEILQELYKTIRPGIKIIDHNFTHIFWEIVNARIEQNWQMQELAKLEEDIAKEKNFLQQIFDSNEDLMVVLDKRKRVQMANKKFCVFIGISEVEIIGKEYQEILRGKEIDFNDEEFTISFEQIFTNGYAQTILRKTPSPDETHWEINRVAIKNNLGEVESVLITWHKITERIMLRREIESAEMRFKSFINSAKDWISIKDLNGRYVIANPVTADAFGLKPEDFIGKKPHEILPKKLAQTVTIHDNQVIASKKYQTFDEIIPVHGEDHHFQTVRFPLTDYKGEIIGVCTIARDVSNEVRLKEQLIQSEKLAALGKLAAGVAHEINNPLTGILAYAEDLINEFPENSEQRNDIQVIIRETLRCRDIVRNLLDFSRQDIPKFQVSEVNQIVENAMNLVKKLPQFKDIIIITSMKESLPRIFTDPQQLIQVILNFMLNAADAMKFKGTISLSTDFDKSNNKCIISVEDTGPGIPENLIDKIFEPFFSTKGTSGLGLAVSWGIIERHGGNIEVDTAESGGAIFRIIIPVYKKNKN
ncbi:PAS domain S-box protein [Bacteroidetes/Chlorobi group bacterium ChocPot_Mid]|nr:MAG: PAS domain S-box protein [Bacteroidetes/Chlorobi group bacterium ChocPot_Mid]